MDGARYCTVCGGVLDRVEIEERSRSVCGACGRIHYVNPIPSVVAVLEQEGKVLLVQRAVQPGKGYWCLPGGFIETGETAQDAIAREVREETGLECRPLELLDVCSDLGGFYGDILVVCFRAEALGGELKAGDDAMSLDFFPADNVPRLAFPCHRRFLEKFWQRALSSRQYV
ncbi:MAG: NUDIX hydrolase [Calditrichaeota bacterium]|nr:NUDIX hydrolase [Calditrichota bacterium]